jgi:hypothetical protein
MNLNMNWNASYIDGDDNNSYYPKYIELRSNRFILKSKNTKNTINICF